MDLQAKPWRDGDHIVIVAAQTVMRECLARVFNQERGVAIECFSTLDEWVHSGPLPDPSLVVLCQIGLSKTAAVNEVERFSQVAAQAGNCVAVVVSDNEDPDAVAHMLDKNIRGYLPTSLSVDVVMHAMDLVRAGGVFVPASSLIAAQCAPECPEAAPKNNLFTARQAAVVEALRRGKPNKIIAYELKMRESTVKVHVRNIMKKLHATNRTEVAYMTNRLLKGE